MFRKLSAKLLKGTRPLPSDAWRTRSLLTARARFVTPDKNKFEFIWDHNCLLVFKEQEPKIKLGLPEGYENWNEGMEYSVDAEIDGTEYRFQVIVMEGLAWQVRTHSRKRTEMSFVRMSE